jgi:hypothetical protein
MTLDGTEASRACAIRIDRVVSGLITLELNGGEAVRLERVVRATSVQYARRDPQQGRRTKSPQRLRGTA